MQIYQNASLKPYHTFSIDVTCSFLVVVETLEDLNAVYKKEEWGHLNKLMVGKGSNLLFTQHYSGVVIINRIMGKKVSKSEDNSGWLLEVQGGEDWPELVEWSVQQGYGGLENLALIPGCAGSAPIQNIGAYGVEFKDVCAYVDILHLDDYSIQRLPKDACLFGYRDSIFKGELASRAVIVAVGIWLPTPWIPKRSYSGLQAIPEDQLSPNRIYETVCQIRREKLPDPDEFGNAGSFFKNPVVDTEKYDALKARYGNLPAYPAEKGVKLAAGWMIDQCGLKGVRKGGAQVHEQQALVLINRDNATSDDIIRLATYVRSKVKAQFGITLEHEVRFMGEQRETSLDELNKEKQ